MALTVFAGGMRQPEVGRLDTVALLARVLPNLRELLGVTGEPVFTTTLSGSRPFPNITSTTSVFWNL